jgi:DNA-binding transcriptional ArsR family regulator
MNSLKELQPLNPILHSELRLAIISLLVSLAEADFNHLKITTKATAGNLSVQINKLKDAGYITVEKKFKDNYPLTLCKITPLGEEAFQEYVQNLQAYIKK